MAEIGTITVSRLNEYIKHKLDNDLILKGISVSGEISNCRTYSSGHMYFTLKDSGSSLRCVMFKGYRVALTQKVNDGDAVTVRGDVSVYVRDGGYQLYATSIKKQGAGELYERYLELKARLEREGLFSIESKKPLPKYPEVVGVITSDSGAVYHDIMNVSARRFPMARIRLFPSRVQGEGADDELIDALKLMDKSGCDVAIIGRGGGSIEDLWQFNSEKLARAICEINTPIISAVGHETDYTICDFVCDMRAPTPSAAAELALPDVREVRMDISRLQDDMITAIMGDILQKRSELQNMRLILRQGLSSGTRRTTARLTELNAQIRANMRLLMQKKRAQLQMCSGMIEANNPIALMNRGYAAVMSENKRIKSAAETEIGAKIDVIFADGELNAQVTGGKVYEKGQL